MRRLYALTHVASYVLLAGGWGYAVVKYWMPVSTELGPMPHPWQKYFLSAHILWAAVFVLAIGSLLPTHIIPRLKTSRRKRGSGLVLIGSVSVMVASGYLIQVSYDERLREIFILAHLVSSGIFTLGYAFHHFSR